MNELTLYHFMTDKLNLYSDIGNIIALKQRAKWRNIKLNVVEVNETEGVTLMDVISSLSAAAVTVNKRLRRKN